jgi:fibronectin type 3 domain-containing protein
MISVHAGAMTMKLGLNRIPLLMTLFLLAGSLYTASLVGCAGTKLAATSKIAEGDGQVTLSWERVATASSYNIYYGNSPGVTKQNGKKIAAVTVPHTIMGLERGKVYYFVVTAVNKHRESEESEEISYSVE